MNKLLLLLSLIAVDCGWDNHSMLIAETQSRAGRAAVCRGITVTAAEDEREQTASAEDSPSGTF